MAENKDDREIDAMLRDLDKMRTDMDAMLDKITLWEGKMQASPQMLAKLQGRTNGVQEKAQELSSTVSTMVQAAVLPHPPGGPRP